MTNYKTDNDITVEDKVIERVTQYKYLGQIIQVKNQMSYELNTRIRAGWRYFGRNKEIFQNPNIPMSLKTKVFNHCIISSITYDYQTWIISKQLTTKLKTTQRAVKRKMLNIKLQDVEIRK